MGATSERPHGRGLVIIIVVVIVDNIFQVTVQPSATLEKLIEMKHYKSSSNKAENQLETPDKFLSITV